MKIDVLNTKGEKVEQITLSDTIFKIKPNKEVLLQYLRVFSSNNRQGTSKVKDRSEVSGGGKKPWKQKGTGRARVGSSRNPLWRHGGVAHGPTPKDWSLSLNKKDKKTAMKSALSQKFEDKKVIVLDKIDFDKPKTKALIEILNALKLFEEKILIVVNNKDTNVIKSTSNINSVICSTSENINAYEVLNSGYVVFIKKAIKNLEEKLLDKKESVEDKKDETK